MAERRIVVEAKIRGTNFATRIVVPQSLAQALVQNDENLEEVKKPGYIQARKRLKKETGKDPGWLDNSNCDFKIIGEASWVGEKDKPSKPFQRKLFQSRKEKDEEENEPIQQKLF